MLQSMHATVHVMWMDAWWYQISRVMLDLIHHNPHLYCTACMCRFTSYSDIISQFWSTHASVYMACRAMHSDVWFVEQLWLRFIMLLICTVLHTCPSLCITSIVIPIVGVHTCHLTSCADQCMMMYDLQDEYGLQPMSLQLGDMWHTLLISSHALFSLENTCTTFHDGCMCKDVRYTWIDVLFAHMRQYTTEICMSY